MTALTANVSRPVRPPVGGVQTRALPLAGYTNFAGGNVAHKIYKGSVVFCDESDTDGYYKRPTTNDAGAADIVGGVALESQEVTSELLADGLVDVTVAIDGVWGFPKGGIAITDIGAPAYASDDATITTTSTTAVWIGFIIDVDGTYVWVDIAPACGHINAVPAA